MTAKPEQPPVQDDAARWLYLLRRQRVILDMDLARLYGVTTKRLNEQYRRNLADFLRTLLSG